MTIKNIKKRAFILKNIRDFFNGLQYLEVETPLLSPSLIPETNLSIFETEYIHPFKKGSKTYLVPSPEVWLKRFLCEHPINIYEISKCFRNSEQSGKQHNPEFTMIEYYSMDFNHLDTLNLTIELLNFLNENIPNSKLPKKHLKMSMDQAFIKYAGFSLKENYNILELKNQAERLDIHIEDDDNWETTFNRIFIDLVEPSLPKNVNLFLTDFPSAIRTLAKQINGTPWSERWELYINGIECGNCYTEEGDPIIINRYFKEEKDVNHRVDMDYPSIFKTFPKCSGGAIGIDRLIMGILGIQDIQGVILFPHHGNI